MRSVMVALTALGLLAITAGHGSAADGCSYDAYGRLYCRPGAAPNVPYYGRGGYQRYPDAGGYGYQRRPPSRRALQYYCSLGDQTPISAREDCIRYGFWR